MRPAPYVWARLLPTEFVVGAATLGPIGRIRLAPGTWGSLAGLMFFTILFYPMAPIVHLVFNAGLLWLAVILCGEAEFRLGRHDPPEIVLDEFAAMPLCFLGWSVWYGIYPTWAILASGFVLFRIFDILKPFGIRRLQDRPGGWGVVADDVGAALAACATLHVGAWLLAR